MDLDAISQLVVPNTTKIVLIVADGIGGLPDLDTGRSELEAASIPHIERLAMQSERGLTLPVARGITPGSGPGHLALFGYDPLKYTVGRGALEALGIDFDLQPQDLAARGNFCTVDSEGRVTDRRAGRIPTETCAALCEKLRAIKLPDVELFVEPVREHRFLLVLRGKDLSDDLPDTDPQREGVPPLPPTGRSPAAQPAAKLVARFVEEAARILADDHPANMLLLRGFAKHPRMPHMTDVFGLRAGAIAVYPMYRGLAKLVGMTVLPTGSNLRDEVATLRQRWDEFDFFFLHFKRTDSAGEDGNFDAKIQALEELDAVIPAILDLAPDVLMLTGDHSTPTALRSHSWHPVPFLLHSRWVRAEGEAAFHERACARGSLGLFEAKEAIVLAMAHALRLTKYGA